MRQQPTHLLGVVQEEVGVMRVGAAEDDGGRGEGGGGLAGEVGARVVLVDAVRLPGRRHVLGPLPAAVVRVAVPHLSATRERVSIPYTVLMTWPLAVVTHTDAWMTDPSIDRVLLAAGAPGNDCMSDASLGRSIHPNSKRGAWKWQESTSPVTARTPRRLRSSSSR